MSYILGCEPQRLRPVCLIGSVIGTVVLLLLLRLFRGRCRDW